MDECGDSCDGLRKEHPEADHRWLSQYQCENQPQSVPLPTPEGGQYAGERGVFIQKIFRENYYPNERKIPEKNPQSPQIHGTCIGNQVPQEGRRYPHRAHGQDTGAEAPRNLRVHSPGLLYDNPPGLCGAKQQARAGILHTLTTKKIVNTPYKSICKSICRENRTVCPHPPVHTRCHSPSPRIYRKKSPPPEIRGHDVVPASETTVYHHEAEPRNPQVSSLHCADGNGEDAVTSWPLRRIPRYFHLCGAPCGSGSSEIGHLYG